jgi:uncharacterized repeat protein (TIGR01451 family)
VGPLGPGVSSQITLTVAVGSAAVPGVTNTATVTTAGDVNPGNNGATDPTAVVPATPGTPGPDLAMTVQANGVTPGSQGTYVVTLTNVGQGATTGPIDLSIQLPAGVSFQSFAGLGVPGQSVSARSAVGPSAPGDWTCTPTTPQQVACRYAGLLAPGQSTTLTLTVAVSPGASTIGPATFTVTTPGDLNSANNTDILDGAVQAPPQQPAPQNSPGDDQDRHGDKDDKPTEQERRQRERTNAASEDDERTEGDVIDVSGNELDPPEIVIGTRDGPQTVRLVKDAKGDARHIRVGDYLEADGWKEHEGLFYADGVKIRRR